MVEVESTWTRGACVKVVEQVPMRLPFPLVPAFEQRDESDAFGSRSLLQHDKLRYELVVERLIRFLGRFDGKINLF
ncbi:MAG: hypothetical protein ACLT98_02340 [Eggerthellaceae bacterium]